MKTDILPLGDRALLVQFEQAIGPEINDQVIQVKNSLEQLSIPGIEYFIPAYCSLTIGFDPTQVSMEGLVSSLQTLQLSSQAQDSAGSDVAVSVHIPVCYQENFAPDMEAIIDLTGLSKQNIISLHSTTLFRVYMLGFIPGFAYMGTLPPALHCPRRQSPRLQVPTGSVGLAGAQTGIYPAEAPGGWQLIGRTPIPAFDPQRESPFLLQAGNVVHFYPISKDEYEKIDSQIRLKQFDYSQMYA